MEFHNGDILIIKMPWPDLVKTSPLPLCWQKDLNFLHVCFTLPSCKFWTLNLFEVIERRQIWSEICTQIWLSMTVLYMNKIFDYTQNSCVYTKYFHMQEMILHAWTICICIKYLIPEIFVCTKYSGIGNMIRKQKYFSSQNHDYFMVIDFYKLISSRSNKHSFESELFAYKLLHQDETSWAM